MKLFLEKEMNILIFIDQLLLTQHHAKKFYQVKQ